MTEPEIECLCRPMTLALRLCPLHGQHAKDLARTLADLERRLAALEARQCAPEPGSGLPWHLRSIVMPCEAKQ